MGTMSSDYIHPFETFLTYENDCDSLIWSTSEMQIPVSVPHTPGLGHEESAAMLNACDSTRDSSSNRPAGFWGQGLEIQSRKGDLQDSEDVFGTCFRQLTATTTPTCLGSEIGLFADSLDSDASRDQTNTVFESTMPVSNVLPRPELDNSPQEAEVEAEPVVMRRPRTQNHSCDSCRSAKKACDLPASITIHNKKPSRPCLTCIVRGVECRVAWLACRLSSQHVKKRARPPSHHAVVGTPAQDGTLADTSGHVDALQPSRLTSISIPEDDLSRQLTARTTCIRQLNLYVDVVDMPMTECISGGCMPPTLPLGLDALTSLSNSTYLSTYVKQAESWILDCWETKPALRSSAAPSPRIFLAASVLDALFQGTNPQAYHSRPATSRDASINETYKWVAITAATQFVLGKDEGRKNQARDIAHTAWHKAKQLLFNNIANTSSFRLALSLILFGIVIPPASANGDSAFEEDAGFAHHEGIRRLQNLCTQARAFCRGDTASTSPIYGMGMQCSEKTPHPVHKFPEGVRENILELIGAFQWLVVMSNSVSIAASQGRICAIPPQAPDTTSACFLAKETVPQLEGTGSVTAGQCEKNLHDSIVTRARAESHTVTALWRRDTAEEVIINVVGKSGSLVVILFHVLALLTVESLNILKSEATYDAINQHVVTLLTLVDVWRSGFGRYNKFNSTLSIQQSGYEVRQFVFFCSNDGDLAILLFYKLATQLEDQLKDHPSSPAKERLCATIKSTRRSRREHRLASAMQVSFLASTAHGLSSPGFEGTSGLKIHVEDIAAHPHPSLLIQLHTLAAEAFSDEIASCITQIDSTRALEMATHLEACLQGLQRLKQGLVVF